MRYRCGMPGWMGAGAGIYLKPFRPHFLAQHDKKRLHAGRR